MGMRSFTLIVLVALFCAACAQLSPANQADILAAVNLIRSNVDSSPTESPLEWDTNLALVAQDWADGCYYGSNPNATKEYQDLVGGSATVGESIAFRLNSSESAKQFIYLWGNEVAYWSYPQSCADSEICTDYIQIIWAATTKIGCGMANCANMTDPSLIPSGNNGKREATGYVSNTNFLVCDYSTAGNIVGENPYVQPPMAPTTPSSASSMVVSLSLIAVALIAMVTQYL